MMVYYHNWNVTENLRHVPNGCSKEVVADPISLKVGWRTTFPLKPVIVSGEVLSHPRRPEKSGADFPVRDSDSIHFPSVRSRL